MKALPLRRWAWLIGAWLGANFLAWVPADPTGRSLGILLLGVALPGWLAFEALFEGEEVTWPEAALLAGGLGYAALLLVGGLLHAWPGPIPRQGVAGAFNGLIVALSAIRLKQRRGLALKGLSKGAWWGLGLVLGVAIAFRLPDLGYAEFQGDEVNVVHIAASAIQGREDVLFYHKKGPAELLTTAVFYGGARLLTESGARLPFAVANILFVLGLYSLAYRFAGPRAALWAGLLAALNGFFVAFGRIVQYQSLVLLLGVLALYNALAYAERRRAREVWLGALFVALGLLAHTDALFAALAAAMVILVVWGKERPSWRQAAQRLAGPIGLAGVLLAAFYIPYVRHPFFHIARTYVSARQGLIPCDNLGHLITIGTVYNSIYYLGFFGVGILGVIGEGLGRFRRWGIVLLTVAATLLLSAWFAPERWQASGRSYVVLAYLAALLPLVWAPNRTLAWRAAFIWFAVPLVTYLFFFADPRTHLYIAFPGACLLLGGGLAELEARLGRLRWVWYAFCAGVLGLAGVYLYILFVHHNPEYKRTYPAYRWPIFWAPYGEKMPTQGLFGFPYRAGWKVIGALYAQGTLHGDYGTNEETHITHWYTRGAPACGSQPRYYIIAEYVQDEQPVPLEEIARDYTLVGRVWVGRAPKMALYERNPAVLPYRDYRVEDYATDFDRRLSGLDYAPLVRGLDPLEDRKSVTAYHFGERVVLVGYSADKTARPGDILTVTLYWHALEALPESYAAFVHIVRGGALWAQKDSAPNCGLAPTTRWRPGEDIRDPHPILLSPTMPPGEYALTVGMYSHASGERLPIADGTGHPLGDEIVLDTITVVEP